MRSAACRSSVEGNQKPSMVPAVNGSRRRCCRRRGWSWPRPLSSGGQVHATRRLGEQQQKHRLRVQNSSSSRDVPGSHLLCCSASFLPPWPPLQRAATASASPPRRWWLGGRSHGGLDGLVGQWELGCTATAGRRSLFGLPIPSLPPRRIGHRTRPLGGLQVLLRVPVAWPPAPCRFTAAAALPCPSTLCSVVMRSWRTSAGMRRWVGLCTSSGSAALGAGPMCWAAWPAVDCCVLCDRRGPGRCCSVAPAACPRVPRRLPPLIAAASALLCRAMTKPSPAPSGAGMAALVVAAPRSAPRGVSCLGLLPLMVCLGPVSSFCLSTFLPNVCIMLCIHSRKQAGARCLGRAAGAHSWPCDRHCRGCGGGPAAACTVH